MDANVLFSAAITPAGRTRAIFELAEGSEACVTLLATEYVLRETRTNLERKAPSYLPELEALLGNVTVLKEPSARLVEQLAPLVPDPLDAPVVAGAVSGEADLLVTGNEKHFRGLYGKEVRGVLVLRPREALDLLTP
ncbi:MAG: PIN domain-containing protein [Rubrobacteraceae bacterium]